MNKEYNYTKLLNGFTWLILWSAILPILFSVVIIVASIPAGIAVLPYLFNSGFNPESINATDTSLIIACIFAGIAMFYTAYWGFRIAWQPAKYFMLWTYKSVWPVTNYDTIRIESFLNSWSIKNGINSKGFHIAMIAVTLLTFTTSIVIFGVA